MLTAEARVRSEKRTGIFILLVDILRRYACSCSYNVAAENG